MSTTLRTTRENHEKIRHEAKLKGKKMSHMVNEIIDFYFDSKEREIDRRVQHVIETQINKMDSHLASLQARNNIDTAMILVMHLMLVEKVTKGEMNQDKLRKFAREQATKYLKVTREEDKKNQ